MRGLTTAPALACSSSLFRFQGAPTRSTRLIDGGALVRVGGLRGFSHFLQVSVFQLPSHAVLARFQAPYGVRDYLTMHQDPRKQREWVLEEPHQVMVAFALPQDNVVAGQEVVGTQAAVYVGLPTLVNRHRALRHRSASLRFRGHQARGSK